ncbi:hypothetical protein RUM44_013322 [Polyplax serrata]|uniref:Uncharacterized protein n=1 Tax=Polyplax serrata TaxID=468196 RepID=A0ABR1BI16_POLSC
METTTAEGCRRLERQKRESNSSFGLNGTTVQKQNDPPWGKPRAKDSGGKGVFASSQKTDGGAKTEKKSCFLRIRKLSPKIKNVTTYKWLPTRSLLHLINLIQTAVKLTNKFLEFTEDSVEAEEKVRLNRGLSETSTTTKPHRARPLTKRQSLTCENFTIALMSLFAGRVKQWEGGGQKAAGQEANSTGKQKKKTHHESNCAPTQPTTRVVPGAIAEGDKMCWCNSNVNGIMIT